MIICSWNINGVKSLLSHNILALKDYNIDVLLLQEVRTGNVSLLYDLAAILDFPHVCYNLSEKSGRAGVATLSKVKIDAQFYPDYILPDEGRIMAVVINDIAIINLYTPYIGLDQINLIKRSNWEREIIDFLRQVKDRKYKLIIGGDLNVAPEQIDRYKVSKSQPGCSMVEASMFYKLLESLNLRDAFRELYNGPGYTWGVNEGRLRIDFFLVDKIEELIIEDCFPLYELHKLTIPSDHYPLILSLKTS